MSYAYEQLKDPPSDDVTDQVRPQASPVPGKKAPNDRPHSDDELIPGYRRDRGESIVTS